MSHPPNSELFAQIQKLLDPTGSIVKGAPNLTPTKGSEHQQHTPHHEKKAGLIDSMRSMPGNLKQLGANPESRKAMQEVGGLGVLALPALDEGQAWARARIAGDKSSEGVEKRQILPDAGHAAAELAGLGILAHPELHHLRMPKVAAILDELEKVGFVSDAEAARALDSLNSIEQDKPTKRQTLGYMGAGAALTPAFHMAANAVRKKPLLDGVSRGDKARDAAAQALKGGFGGTAVSMAQRHIDRSDKTNTLKAYLAQHEAQTQDPDLQKAAAAKKKKNDEEKKPSNLKKFLGGTAGSMAMTAGNMALGQHLSGKLQDVDQPLYDAVKSKTPKGLNVHEGFHPDLRGEGPHFLAGRETPLRAQLPSAMRDVLDVDPYVSTAGSKNPSILAHELGHADIHGSRAGRALQNPATISLGGAAPAVGQLTGAFSGLSDNKRVQQAGILAPALLSLPQLAFEAGASIQGLRRMRGAGANTAQMVQGLKTLAPAFGTYGTRAGLGVAGAYQSQGLVGGIRGMINNGQEKEAGAPRLVGPKMPGLAGSGTPVMPMPKPQPVGIGVG